MILQKKVTKAGSITIPTMMREELNIPKGAAVELESVDGKLIVKKHIPTCQCCGSADHVIVFKGMEVCQNCLKEAKEVYSDGND